MNNYQLFRIHKIGLLPPGNHQQVPFAYKMYTREDDLGWEQSNQFKKAFSVDVDIEFVGVWYPSFHSFIHFIFFVDVCALVGTR